MELKPGQWMKAPHAKVISAREWHEQHIGHLLPPTEIPEASVIDWEDDESDNDGELLSYTVGGKVKSALTALRKIARQSIIPHVVTVEEFNWERYETRLRQMVLRFVQAYGPLVRDFCGWCVFTESNRVMPTLPGLHPFELSDIPSSWIPDTGYSEALYIEKIWMQYGYTIYQSAYVKHEIAPVLLPAPFSWYVYMAGALTRLWEQPYARPSQKFLAKRIASLRLIPGKNRTLQFMGNLLDYLALASFYGISGDESREHIIKECANPKCKTDFSTFDDRIEYCDDCATDERVKNAARVARWRQKHLKPPK